MLRKDGRKRYYFPSQLRWRGDNKDINNNAYEYRWCYKITSIDMVIKERKKGRYS